MNDPDTFLCRTIARWRRIGGIAGPRCRGRHYHRIASQRSAGDMGAHR
jgi:hypothetical protein